MRSLWWNETPATGWFAKAPSRRGLQRLFLWCLVVAAAQVLLSSPQFSVRTLTATGRLASGRVVVTGGGGNIGKHLVQRLLASGTAVTVVDHIFYPDELGLNDSASNPLLDVHIGDIRNTTLLSSIFTSDVVGVVHLADVSRVLRCEENPADCKDVNERGTQLVLDSLEHLNRNDQGKRWFILASSLEVYGHTTAATPLREDAPTKPLSVYGASKLAAERAVETRVRNTSSSNAVSALRAISLRLAHVYGGSYDHEDRLVPAITTQALWNQVIQVSGGQQILDMLHMDDCVDAFLLAIQFLARDPSFKTRFFKAPMTFQVFNIASGHVASVSRLAENVISLTQSKSPIRTIPADAHFSNALLADVQKAQRQLGFRASVNIEEGLGTTLRMYMQRFEQYFSRRITHTCATPLPNVLDKQLEKLDGCIAHIHINDDGRLHSLSLSPEAPHFRSDDKLLGRDMDVKISSGLHARKRTIRISDHETGFYLGSKNPWTRTDFDSIVPISEDDVKSNTTFYVDWELEADPETSAVRFILSGTEFQLAYERSSLRLRSTNDTRSPPFRFTPKCCPTPGPWPFVTDDPFDYSTEYQRDETEAPFLGSPKKAFCDRLETALKRVRGKLAAPLPSLSHKYERRMSAHAANWSMATLPACSNICEDVTICIDAGDCQCVVDSCVHRQRSPFSASTHGSGVSFPRRIIENEPLAEAVETWKYILRPAVRRFIDAKVPFPRIHVAPLSPTNKAYVKDLGSKFYDSVWGHCFSADVELEKSVARMGVPLRDAEMTFIPLYWERFPGLQGYFEQYDYVKEHLPGLEPGRVVMPFTHDWGQCVIWVPNIWELRKTHGPTHFPMVRNTTGWSTMGDLNSVCYRPHQDVIIPPRTCLTVYHYKSFGNMADVQPSRSRSVLATFKGTNGQTGVHTRTRLQCARSGWTPESPGCRLYPGGPRLRVVWGSFGPHSDYNSLLNDTVFCPQAAGSTGWTTRLIDSMYAGCIPVFVGHATHYVFHDMLDWSKISVRIETHEISRLEDLLLSRYSLEDVERLQRNIMAIRSALTYPLDGWDPVPSQRLMLDERGPLYFALHSTRMKLMTSWPT